MEPSFFPLAFPLLSFLSHSPLIISRPRTFFLLPSLRFLEPYPGFPQAARLSLLLACLKGPGGQWLNRVAFRDVNGWTEPL